MHPYPLRKRSLSKSLANPKKRPQDPRANNRICLILCLSLRLQSLNLAPRRLALSVSQMKGQPCPPGRLNG